MSMQEFHQNTSIKLYWTVDFWRVFPIPIVRRNVIFNIKIKIYATTLISKIKKKTNVTNPNMILSVKSTNDSNREMYNLAFIFGDCWFRGSSINHFLWKGAVNLSHWADRQANGLFAHPRSNVISWLALLTPPQPLCWSLTKVPINGKLEVWDHTAIYIWSV